MSDYAEESGVRSQESEVRSDVIPRPSARRLKQLEAMRHPTVEQIEERNFLRDQLAWVAAGGPGRTDAPRDLEPLPKE